MCPLTEKMQPVDLNGDEIDRRILTLHLLIMSPNVLSRYVQKGKHITSGCFIPFVIIEQTLFSVGLCHWFVRFLTSYLAVLWFKGFKMFVTPLQKELPTGCHACKTRTRAFK